MKNISNKRPATCPNCGGIKIASILYGLPALTPKLEKEIDKGNVVLGGCCVSDCDPAWQCMACEAKIYKTEVVEALEHLIFDKDHEVSPISEVCDHCRHLFDPGVDRECLAFPDGIPLDIWMGYDQHTEPHPDQENDIVFEEKDFL